MASLQVSSFDISDDIVQEIAGGDITLISSKVVFDPTPPAGWMIVVEGPFGSRVACPKPCPTVS